MSSHPSMRLLQINLHHSKAASASLHKYVEGKSVDIIFIQEPYVYKNKICGLGLKNYGLIHGGGENPRSCILFKRSLHMLPLNQFCSRDLAAASWREELGDGACRYWIVAAAYFPHEGRNPTPDEVVNLVEECKTNHKHLILALDFNTHHEAWCSILEH